MHTALRYSKAFGEFSDCSPEPLPEGDMLPFKPTSHCQRDWIWTKLETSKTKAAVKKKQQTLNIHCKPSNIVL